METKEKATKSTHHGHAVKRFRHTLGVKQDALAIDLGISQAMISMYESKKIIEDDMIEKFAKALGVAPQLIKDLEEDPVTVIIENNTFGDNGIGYNYIEEDNSTNTYNPLEKILEISNEKQALYERMLELEREKTALLEKMLSEKK